MEASWARPKDLSWKVFTARSDRIDPDPIGRVRARQRVIESSAALLAT